MFKKTLRVTLSLSIIFGALACEQPEASEPNPPDSQTEPFEPSDPAEETLTPPEEVPEEEGPSEEPKEDQPSEDPNFFTGIYVPGPTAREFMVDANPEAGFNIPYFIYLPSTKNQTINENAPRHLLLEGLNFGIVTNDIYAVMNQQLHAGLDTHLVTDVTEALFIPKVVPYLPKTCVTMTSPYGTESGHFHALDSTVIRLKEYFDQVKPCVFPDENIPHPGGQYLRDLFDIDQQISAIVDDAKERLNMSGWNLEEKIFLAGFSASGSFADAYTSMFPSQVQAMFAGGLFIPTQPITEHEGHTMSYQLGVSEYGTIMGDPFDLETFNQVAKMYYMGELETIDAVEGTDVYTDYHRSVIYSIYGTQSINDRWYNAQTLFFASGGDGLFITDKTAEHHVSSEVIAMAVEFFKINRGVEAPNYDLALPSENVVFHLNGELSGEIDRKGVSNNDASDQCSINYDFTRQRPNTLAILAAFDPYSAQNHPFNTFGLNGIYTGNSVIMDALEAEYLIYFDYPSNSIQDLCDYFAGVNFTTKTYSYYLKGDQKILRVYGNSVNELLTIIESMDSDVLDVDWDQIATRID